MRYITDRDRGYGFRFYDDFTNWTTGGGNYTVHGDSGGTVTQSGSAISIKPKTSAAYLHEDVSFHVGATFGEGFVYRTRVQLPSLTSIQVVEIGVHDDPDVYTGGTTWAIFLYDPTNNWTYGVSTTNWIVTTGSAAAAYDTGIPVTTGVFDLMIVASSGSAKYYINGALVKTETSDVPADGTSLYLNWEIRSKGAALSVDDVDIHAA